MASVEKLHQRQSQFCFQSSDAKGGVIELNLFFMRAMRCMITGENFQRAISEPGDNGLAIFGRTQRWVHFTICIKRRPLRALGFCL